MPHQVQLSNDFKRQTTRAVFAIVFFVITYLLLLIFAVGLTAACVYGGVQLIIMAPRVVTIGVGVGLMSLGLMVLYFLLKFLFSGNTVDRSELLEITRTDEPKLFAMIDDIVRQVETDFPKRVYLTDDVNASVFYDSSFWSMFLPIKKNLQIGVGLINSVTEAELKAILAHEFGHFSQRTMKVGSYVYNVNHIIYNLVNDNDGYNNIISNWASVSGYFSIFVSIAVWIVRGIQWILSKMYGVVNKSYMALSREMEFHADEIAATVTGSAPLKTSLLRLSLASESYDSVLNFYQGKVDDNVKSQNVYRDQSFVMNFLARENEVPVAEGQLPDIPQDEADRFDKSKLVIENQWASHPSTEDRVARLDRLPPLVGAPADGPANRVLQDAAATQQRLTDKLFARVTYAGEVRLASPETFRAGFTENYATNSFPKLYGGYYDHHNPTPFDVDAQPAASKLPVDVGALFSGDRLDLMQTAATLEKDARVIQQIGGGGTEVKTFDYDGRKYGAKEATTLAQRLGRELEAARAKLATYDTEIYGAFLALASANGQADSLRNAYRAFFTFDAEYENNFAIITQLKNSLDFLNQGLPPEEVQTRFSNLAPYEVAFKEQIRTLLAQDAIAAQLNNDMRANFDEYLSRQLRYFDGETFYEKNLGTFIAAVNHYAWLLQRGYFLLKRDLLALQASLVSSAG